MLIGNEIQTHMNPRQMREYGEGGGSKAKRSLISHEIAQMRCEAAIELEAARLRLDAAKLTKGQ